MRRALAMLLLVGCAVGPQGPEGPPGPAGNPGGSGAVGGGFVYRDATGALVGVNTAIYFDAQGRAWWLDVESATLYLLPHQVSGVYYATGDCSGTPYIAPLQPRFPFKMPGETAYRVRPDNLQSAQVTVAAARAPGGACTAVSPYLTRLVPIDSRTVPSSPISEPSLPFAAPLHIEKL